jgi:hypothetical protein
MAEVKKRKTRVSTFKRSIAARFLDIVPSTEEVEANAKEAEAERLRHYLQQVVDRFNMRLYYIVSHKLCVINQSISIFFPDFDPSVSDEAYKVALGITADMPIKLRTNSEFVGGRIMLERV